MVAVEGKAQVADNDLLRPAYVNFVKLMGWVLAGVAVLITSVLILATALTGVFLWPMAAISVGFFITGIIVSNLVTRYYVLSIYILCMVQIFAIPFGCLYLFGMNKATIMGVIVWGIILGGLLLGGLTGAILTGWAFVLIIIAFIIEGMHLAPAPLFSEQTIPPGIFSLLTAVFYLSIIIVFLPIVTLFNSTMQKVVRQVQERAVQQEVLNQQLSHIQEQEHILSGQVASLSSELQAQAEQQATEAAHQAGSAGELTQIMVELRHAAEEITSATSNVATAASQSRQSAEQGRAATDDAVVAMSTIREQVEDIAQQIGTLGNLAGQISHVLELMTEVADETRLLSLNATIEAAGAGTAGSRFSIIAGEVGELANRARGGVAEVEALVVSIANAAGQAITTTEVGVKQAQTGAELSAKAGLAHQEILLSVEQTAGLAQTIAATSQQQQLAAQRAAEAVEQVSSGAQAAASASGSLLEIVRQLSVMSNLLATTSATNQPDATPPLAGTTPSADGTGLPVRGRSLVTANNP